MPKRVLLTGVAGFSGAHITEHFLKHTDWELVGLYSFTHRGCPRRLEHLAHDARLQLIHHDLRAPINERLRDVLGDFDYVVNIASESHVDRSIVEPRAFIENNVALMLTMLEFVRQMKPQVFLQVSTDEVYGAAPANHNHKEWEPHFPSNPYSASKAAQEDIGFSYWRTYRVPLLITNTMNLIGERQEPEKYIPKVISKVLRGEVLEIHGQDGRPGSRFYLHARNQADALQFLLQRLEDRLPSYPQADRPARYHIVGEEEVDNLTLAEGIAAYLGKPLRCKVVNFHASRPGHDLRYALDGGDIAKLGWKAPTPFWPSLYKTIDWSLAHPEWLDVPKEMAVAK